MKRKPNLISVIYALIVLITIKITSCSKSDAPKPNLTLYSGSDITSYANFSADKKSKQTSITILNSGKWSIYSGLGQDAIDFSAPLLQGSSKGIYTIDDSRFRLFCLESGDGSRAAFGLRQIPLEGQSNFRDMGGYKTTDGKHVKWGLVFRSGKCSALTDSDLSYLGTIPLKTLVDFRSADELSSAPDKVPSTVANQLHFPINPGNLSSAELDVVVRNGDIEAGKKYLLDANESFVLDSQEEFSKFFAQLASRDNLPMMFHCTTGKDRAGFASAMFLLALGVDRETVIQDYLLTNLYTNATVEAMKATFGDSNMALTIYYLSSAQPEYLGKAFATIESKYGSIENFLQTQLKVDVKKLREIYLY